MSGASGEQKAGGTFDIYVIDFVFNDLAAIIWDANYHVYLKLLEEVRLLQHSYL